MDVVMDMALDDVVSQNKQAKKALGGSPGARKAPRNKPPYKAKGKIAKPVYSRNAPGARAKDLRTSLPPADLRASLSTRRTADLRSLLTTKAKDLDPTTRPTLSRSLSSSKPLTIVITNDKAEAASKNHRSVAMTRPKTPPRAEKPYRDPNLDYVPIERPGQRLTYNNNQEVLPASIAPAVYDPYTAVTPQSAGFSQGGTTVRISNLHRSASADDLKAVFSRFGEITSMSIQLDADQTSLGVASVTFTGRHAALTAIQQYHNTLVDGNLLKLELVRNPTPASQIVNHISANRSFVGVGRR